MSLTKDDLSAIKLLIDDSIDERVPVIVEQSITTFVPSIIEGIIEPRFVDIDQRLVASFGSIQDEINGLKSDVAEINQDLADVRETVYRIERVRQAEMVRNDHQDLAIKKLQKKLLPA